MQFTRLKLLGFKSFVDPTELSIASGLTGVVGPNGCGKSNLLEALRWVMGENRPSAMRGGGMEDVIFAGSASRPQRNHAEVTLTLDNRARLAPAAFNDSDTLEVVRRITRDAGSAYRANGKEARARDVQMLFADASTGAHSPALVRQGQIAELINAKPKSRRRVLEEAAGISGLYQRRHEAELKLRATETNLARVADVLETLESQMAALERQAKQAARYRLIAEALRRSEAMLIWRLWYDADLASHNAASTLTQAVKAAAQAQGAASAAIQAQEQAEDEMPAIREEDAIAGAVLQRRRIERDRLASEASEVERRIAGLEQALRQIEDDRRREAALDTDAAEVIARLESERAEIETAGEGHEQALLAARDASEAAIEALQQAERGRDEKAQLAARLNAEHQNALNAVVAAEKRSVSEAEALSRAEAACKTLGMEAEQSAAQVAQAEKDAALAVAQATDTEAELAEAEAALGVARAEEAQTRTALSEAEGLLKALGSEKAGIERMLAQSKSDTSGVVDQISVAPGYETALGSAFADDLTLPLAEDASQTGWRELPALAAGVFGVDIEALADHVQAPPAIARRLAHIGVVARDAGAAAQAHLQPGQRLVSRDGDVWRWDGLHIASGDAPHAAALRLQQKNRLVALQAQVTEAEAAANVARESVANAATVLAEARNREQAARAARKSADQAVSETARGLSKARSAQDALAGRLEALESGLSHRRAEAEAGTETLEQTRKALQRVEDPQAAKTAADQEQVRVEAARVTMMTRRAEADELDRAGKARLRRLEEITREDTGWRDRQANAAERIAALDRRAGEAQLKLDESRALPKEIKSRLEEFDRGIDEAETRQRKSADMLAKAEARLRDLAHSARAAEKAAGEAREARARIEAQSEAAIARAEEARERLETETGRDPEGLLTSLEIDAGNIGDAEALEQEANRLKRQRDALGAVNLRADEDARQVAAEHEDLAREKSDLEAAIAKLRQGINNLNREGRERLLDAFDEVNRNFSTLFKHLFGGGEANLVLVESDDPLEAGLEIMCQPPGKKLSTLSLLSGGEQTLTAMSLIFAVFLANPSPICVLDEVDAPLDDANVTRFCDLLDEMTRRTNTRFLIITHHAVTMSRMDRLFGVTMAEQGVSQLVSVDLAAAERIVEDVA